MEQIDLFSKFALTGIFFFVMLAVAYGVIVSRRHNEIPEVFLLSDGVEYKKPGSPPIYVKWAEVQSIDYEWGPWYEDVWGVFPVCEWCFTMTDQVRLRIEDKELTCLMILPALKLNFAGFLGDREFLQKLAWENELIEGIFHCWSIEVSHYEKTQE